MSVLIGAATVAASTAGADTVDGGEEGSCKTAGDAKEGVSAAGIAAFGTVFEIALGVVLVLACCLNFSFSSAGRLEYSSHFCLSSCFFSVGS